MFEMMIKSRRDLRFYIEEDAKRNGFSNINTIAIYIRYRLYLLAGVESAHVLRYLICLRKNEYYHNCSSNFLMKIFYFLLKIKLSRLGLKYNIRIPINKVGYGLRIHHISGGGGCHLYCESMGNYCGVNAGVLLGNNKSSTDIPIIGDGCMFNVGCKVYGNIRIGKNVNIAANAVVTRDVPDNCVVAGIPAKIIKYLDAR